MDRYNTLYVIIILCLMVFVTSCEDQGGEVTTSTPFIGGQEGIQMKFLEIVFWIFIMITFITFMFTVYSISQNIRFLESIVGLFVCIGLIIVLSPLSFCNGLTLMNATIGQFCLRIPHVSNH